MEPTLPVSTKDSRFCKIQDFYGPQLFFTVNFFILLTYSLVQRMEQVPSAEVYALPSYLFIRKLV